jgi:hypothetical protein
MLGDALQHSDRHEIKDFQGALLSSWTINWDNDRFDIAGRRTLSGGRPGGSRDQYRRDPWYPLRI